MQYRGFPHCASARAPRGPGHAGGGREPRGTGSSGRQARHDTDVAQLARLDDQIRTLDQKEFELERLDRKRKLIDENFRSVVKALGDRGVQENVMANKTANVRVIQEAETPIAPTNLRLMIFAAGVLLSLFAGVLAAGCYQTCFAAAISPLKRSNAVSPCPCW